MLEFRPAEPNDAPLLRIWDEKEHVIASDPNDDWAWEIELGKTPDWREMWMASFDEKPIGFIQIIDPALEETHYWGKMEENQRAIDIWIGEETFLRKGLGTKMMQFALDRCFANTLVNRVWIDPLESNLEAIRFYERFGFQSQGNRQFGDDHCLVMILDRSVIEAREGIVF